MAGTDGCDVCGVQAPVIVRCSGLGPVSWGYCPRCDKAGAEPLEMIEAALGTWQRERWASKEQAARRLLSIVHARAVEQGTLVRGGDVLAGAQDAVEPVVTAVAALDRYALGELDADQTVDVVALVCEEWSDARGTAD